MKFKAPTEPKEKQMPMTSTSNGSSFVGPPKVQLNVAPKPTPEIGQGPEKGTAQKVTHVDQSVQPKKLLFEAAGAKKALAIIEEEPDESSVGFGGQKGATNAAKPPGSGMLFQAMA